MKDTNGQKSSRPEKGNPLSIDRRYTIALTGIAILVSLSIYNGKGPLPFVGNSFISLFLLYIFYRDILRYKPDYISKQRIMLAIATLIVSTLLLSRLSDYLFFAMSKGLGVSFKEAHLFLVPLPAGAMLAMLLFDFHTAIFFSFITSLLSGLWLDEPFFAVYFFIGSLVASFSMLNSKKRSSILKGGVFVGITNLIVAIAFLLSKSIIISSTSFHVIGFAFMSGFVVSAIVYITLPLFEYLFKITTDISLVELLDVDHPLMKALMTNAPGTYHHSVIVANLVEAAAENVKVNKLVARVGAYYHDIGKIKKPHYFVENQRGESRHEHITPHMSSLVLIAHTKDGVDLAREHNLPETIIDIIQQHHGDSLITFFYEKAKALGEEVAESDYRYPGPKPTSKEAALIMMADAVEAASRVLTDPSPSRISALVEKIIGRIIMEGQLDECDFTFKEIAEIKNSFIHTLTGIFHKRINYPGFRFDDKDTNKDNSQKEIKSFLPQKGSQEAFKST